ncbi:MAG TPA: hypothetical protein ENI62_13695 [Gammaproteobacteria bacterium]|nr:hypothetical protein [Gammaproteobacteria bacterium]
MHYKASTNRVLTTVAAAILFAISANIFADNGQNKAGQLPIPSDVALASWSDNGHGGRYLLQFARGRTLAKGEQAIGIVASDTNCKPDALGLSHCNNIIRLANGGRITVIDTHKMSANPCLRPGEGITLTGMGGPWIMGILPRG